MSLMALMHGDPGRLPFVGHFRAVRTQGKARLTTAGRVRVLGDVQLAFRIARTIETTILSCVVPEDADRHGLLSAVWDAVQRIEACDLGPDEGENLVILFAIQDEDGTGIAGMGLGGVWAWKDDAMIPLVQGEHPLLGGPGRPEALPGVLTLDEYAEVIVGIAHDHPSETPQPSTWRKRCGVHP